MQKLTKRQYDYVCREILKELDTVPTFNDISVSLEKVIDVIHRCTKKRWYERCKS